MTRKAASVVAMVTALAGSSAAQVPDANPFNVTQQFSAFQAGAYAQATRTVAPRLDVTAGGRIDTYDVISATRTSPRLGVKFERSPRVALRSSYGQYYQPSFFLFLTAYPENRLLSTAFHNYGDAPRAARRPAGKARNAKIPSVFER